jgi:hypothetical protein
MERATSSGSGAGAQRGQHRALEESALAQSKKNAARRGQTIVFIDESGLSERPHRCRTWAPRGHPPILQFHFNWNTLSAIAGVTWWNFYFRLYPGSIKAPQAIDFLGRLLQQLPGRLLIIWDGLPVHRSRKSLSSSRSIETGSRSSGFPPTLRSSIRSSSLGLPQTPRDPESLSKKLVRAEYRGPSRPRSNPSQAMPDYSLLAPSRAVLSVTIISEAQ